MAIAMLVRLWCVGCAADADFEQPPACADHPDSCPEFCCIACGYAVVVPSRDPLVG